MKMKDIVCHTTTTSIGFSDRFKILFGAKVVVKSEIHTTEECIVLKTDVKSFVTPIFTKKPQGAGVPEDCGWVGSRVVCDICTHEWVGVFPDGIERLECPNCEQMAKFTLI